MIARWSHLAAAVTTVHLPPLVAAKAVDGAVMRRASWRTLANVDWPGSRDRAGWSGRAFFGRAFGRAWAPVGAGMVSVRRTKFYEKIVWRNGSSSTKDMSLVGAPILLDSVRAQPAPPPSGGAMDAPLFETAREGVRSLGRSLLSFAGAKDSSSKDPKDAKEPGAWARALAFLRQAGTPHHSFATLLIVAAVVALLVFAASLAGTVIKAIVVTLVVLLSVRYLTAR